MTEYCPDPGRDCHGERSIEGDAHRTNEQICAAGLCAELHGPRDLCRAFPGWLQLNLLADIPRKPPVRAA